MEARDIEGRNLTDEIMESMSETEANTCADYQYRPTSQGPIPPRLPRKPKMLPIPAHGSESIYETPYSTDRNSKNSRNSKTRNQKWWICFLIMWLVIGLLIGATVTGLTMHFTTKMKMEELKSSIDETASLVVELKSKIDETAMKITPKAVVAFRAGCIKNNQTKLSSLSDHTFALYRVTWQNVEYNIGNTFSASTGIFTCPLDGIYAFYATSPIHDSETWIINADERAISISFIYIYVNGSKKSFPSRCG